MKLKKFKEKDNKKIGIILFTIVCILLVSGVILYQTFAVFEVKTNQNVIKGTVQDPGNIYFAFYQKNEENGDYEIQKDMPNQNEGYVLDEETSYCGVNGEKDTNIKVSVNEDWKIIVSGVTTSRTKCNLYFTKGVFIQGKGIPVVKNGDGLYLVEHSANETLEMDVGWQEAEYRYAGSNPHNYVTFNDELWRIIGLVNVLVPQADGSNKVEQRLKIIKNESIGTYAWDSKQSGTGSSKSVYGSNDWTDSELMQYLNEDYYLKLSDNAKNFIDENIVWNIGGASSQYSTLDKGLVSNWYQYERGSTVHTDNTLLWPRPTIWSSNNTKKAGQSAAQFSSELFHSVALLYPSDYGYATNGGYLERNQCFTKYLFGWDENDFSDCKNNDWLKATNISYWTISPFSDNGNASLVITTSGGVDTEDTSVLQNILPTLYLKPSVKIISGTGSAEDAFQIAQVIK